MYSVATGLKSSIKKVQCDFSHLFNVHVFTYMYVIFMSWTSSNVIIVIIALHYVQADCYLHFHPVKLRF